MALSSPDAQCPDCGTRLSDEPWAEGLCLSCLAELALQDSSLQAELADAPDEAPTLQARSDTLAAGQILSSGVYVNYGLSALLDERACKARAVSTDYDSQAPFPILPGRRSPWQSSSSFL
jgi:hypothetical protein